MTDINDFGRTSLVTHTTSLIEKMEKCTMTEQQEKILAVLDMSEDAQKMWPYGAKVAKPTKELQDGRLIESLADIAFRLRDEAVSLDGDVYLTAICKVLEHWEGVCVCDKCYAKTRKGRPMNWWADAKPIHWIVAALLAKESK